jgi:hypothetical protein
MSIDTYSRTKSFAWYCPCDRNETCGAQLRAKTEQYSRHEAASDIEMQMRLQQ